MVTTTFAHYRRARNLPAITINWGVFKETGVVANSAEVAKHLENIGITGFHTDEALEALENVLEENPIQIGVFNIDWQQWAMANPRGADSSRFGDLIGNDFTTGNSQRRDRYKELVQELSELRSEDRQKRMESLICEQMVKVMRIPVQSIDPHQSIEKLGVDSLMTVELKLAFNSNLGIEITSVDLLSKMSISQMVSLLLDKIFPIREMTEALS